MRDRHAANSASRSQLQATMPSPTRYLDQRSARRTTEPPNAELRIPIGREDPVVSGNKPRGSSVGLRGRRRRRSPKSDHGRSMPIHPRQDLLGNRTPQAAGRPHSLDPAPLQLPQKVHDKQLGMPQLASRHPDNLPTGVRHVPVPLNRIIVAPHLLLLSIQFDDDAADGSAKVAKYLLPNALISCWPEILTGNGRDSRSPVAGESTHGRPCTSIHRGDTPVRRSPLRRPPHR